MRSLVFAASLGLLSHALLPLAMPAGLDGVAYYGEVHTSALNRFIHTLGMPFTAYGALVFVPRVLAMRNPARLPLAAFAFYVAHYLPMSLWVTLGVAGLYLFPLVLAVYCERGVWHGLAVCSAALLFQEVFGHWVGGDAPSRLEGIPNAIVYAPYFSVSHG